MGDVEFLKKIIDGATKISKKDFVISSKGDENDLVTNLDIEIEKYLIEEICKNYPTFDIISEELNPDGILTDNCFVIDPIDGTVNFANNIPLWGIQIALIRDGKTVASIINLPELNQYYLADETGAYLNGEKIHIKEVPTKKVVYGVSGNGKLQYANCVSKSLKSFRCFGSACVTFAFLSSGKLQGATFLNNTPWDYIPGLFLCKMAGAKFEDEKNFHAVAINDEVLSILKLGKIKK